MCLCHFPPLFDLCEQCVCLFSLAVILIKGFKIYKPTYKCIVYEGEKVSNVKDCETTKIWKKKNVKIELQGNLWFSLCFIERKVLIF